MTGVLEAGEHGVWVWASYGVSAALFVFLILSAHLGLARARRRLALLDRAGPSVARMEPADDA